ncbi:MAG TPA: NAD(P)/FAD-dependent oxidoreductase [Bryobacteraceae bacterium]|nr:NAD(P)/FAD-dependent oxidoreductase [Bryobacteraceae bacterium]
MIRGYVIGAGPNGLTAAILLARAGLKVTVLEAGCRIGGGTRTEELTVPGFLHDVCSAVHPMALSSPVFASFPLGEHGLEWVHPTAALAHPFDDGTCLTVERSIDETVAQFGAGASIYRGIALPLVRDWDLLMREILAPPHVPRRLLTLGRFGAIAPWPATVTGRVLFRTRESRAVFAGMAAHSILPLEAAGSGAFGWVLMLSAHAAGWPVARGGSQRIAGALASYFQSLGGEIVTSVRVKSLGEFEKGSVVLCDVTPRQFLELAGDRAPDSYRRKVEAWRYGPGVFKIDWAMKAPIPWKSPRCARAATVHLGGSFEDIAESERAPWEGRTHSRPFVLLAQPSLFDASRAPDGMHTAWAYCHVPNGSSADMTEVIESQIERFAPGFRACILARHTMAASDLERHNSNLIGGDISGGANTLKQVLLRPTGSCYRTPLDRVFLCSSSTPPGGGVHGMCGYHAARAALRSLRSA